MTCVKEHKNIAYSHFGCNTPNGGVAMVVTKNRKVVAPYFGYDKALKKTVPDYMWTIHNKKDLTKF